MILELIIQEYILQGKSVKYMRSSNRQEMSSAHTKGGADAANDIKYDVINGEWESEHNYMCSACGALFDELREVMHHKWDEHPYCLVAHVTLREQLQVPPYNMMYPQMGRSMGITKGACHKRKRKLPPAEANKLRVLTTPGPFKCTNCDNNPAKLEDVQDDVKAEPPTTVDPPVNTSLVFDNKEKFHAHVLECGGDTDWQGPGAKKKKKSRQNKDPSERKTGEPTYYYTVLFIAICQATNWLHRTMSLIYQSLCISMLP